MNKTVLITAIGSFSAGTAIQACREEGFRVIGCDIYPAEWVASSLDVDAFYQAPYATDKNAYLDFIRQICRDEDVSLLLPLTDVEIDTLQEVRVPESGELSDLGGVKLCISDYETIAICRNKEKLEQFLAKRKVCRTIPGVNLETAVQEMEKQGELPIPYPVIMKLVDGRSSQGLMRARNREEFLYALQRTQGEWENYMIQPEISGTVVTVDVVRNAQTGSCVCLPRRELLRTLNGAGTSVQVFRDRELEKQCQDIAGALNICGCVNFEFIEEAAGVWHFLECNPRFAGGLGFSHLAGYNMVRNHLNCFLGMEIEPMGDISDQYIARRYTEYRTDGGKS